MSPPVSLIKQKSIDGIKKPQSYLKNIDEPRDKPARDKPVSSETTLRENSRPMRQRFRQIAHNIKVIKLRRNVKNHKNN